MIKLRADLWVRADAIHHIKIEPLTVRDGQQAMLKWQAWVYYQPSPEAIILTPATIGCSENKEAAELLVDTLCKTISE